MKVDEQLVKAVVSTAELMGTTLTVDSARMFCADLSAYPAPMVLDALRRCRREVTGRLTLAAVVSRLDDGHVGPEEAWAMMPRDEMQTVVWTDQMAESWGIASALLAEGDQVGARMAFREHYTKAVQQARDAGVPPKWRASLGHDPAGREAAIRAAVEQGRLSAEHGQKLLPNGRYAEQLPALPEYVTDVARRLQ
jgi:hypothetical protein